MNRPCAFAALLLFAALAHATESPQQRLAPGGVARIALGPSTEAPRASFNGVPVMVVRQGSQWLALVGIGLSATPGAASLVLQRDGSETALPFAIKPFHYAEQRLKVAPGQVDLAPDDLARYERGKRPREAGDRDLHRDIARDAAARAAGARPPQQLVRAAPRVQRPVAQPAQRHGHRGAAGHDGARARRGPRDRHRQLLLQRQHGLARPWRRAADDVLPPVGGRGEGRRPGCGRRTDRRGRHDWARDRDRTCTGRSA